ncbi:MAG: hypothetical protein IH608_11215 [Proteobacteria bacterium]|nr:hypothetical protein [Pseudomonadota bacterium]
MPTAVALGLVGLACVWFRWEVSLFLNVDLTFGSLFVFLSFLFCGTWPGLATAVIVYAGKVAVYHHPWTFALFLGEALVIAAGGRTRVRHLATLVTAYWLLVGAPLGWSLYHFAMGVPPQSALVVMSKNLLNEVLNALLATMVFLGAMDFRRRPDERPSFRLLVFTPAPGRVARPLPPAHHHRRPGDAAR